MYLVKRDGIRKIASHLICWTPSNRHTTSTNLWLSSSCRNYVVTSSENLQHNYFFKDSIWHFRNTYSTNKGPKPQFVLRISNQRGLICLSLSILYIYIYSICYTARLSKSSRLSLESLGKKEVPPDGYSSHPKTNVLMQLNHCHLSDKCSINEILAFYRYLRLDE